MVKSAKIDHQKQKTVLPSNPSTYRDSIETTLTPHSNTTYVPQTIKPSLIQPNFGKVVKIGKTALDQLGEGTVIEIPEELPKQNQKNLNQFFKK